MARVLIIAVAGASLAGREPGRAAVQIHFQDRGYSASWFTEKGPQVIERAMDECAVLSREDLYVRHVMESADSALRDAEDLDVMEHLKTMRPTFKQLRNCINAKIAYDGLFEAKG